MSVRRETPFLLAAILFLILLTAGAASADHSAAKKRVLILNSYHHGYKWTDDETKGILSVLGNDREHFRIDIEYMDTKKFGHPGYFRDLHTLYRAKYRSTVFDLVIVTDNDAFDFMRLYRDDLFPGTPVVFCGYNFLKESDLSGLKDFTGVNEEADLKGGIDTALSLLPDTREIVIITDTTVTGAKVRERLAEILPDYQDRISFSILDDIDMQTLGDTVEELESGSMVFFTFFFRDSTGAFFEFDDSISMISSRSRVPVFGAWDFSLGFGIAGGLLTSGTDQGRTAGMIALRILNGEPAGSIPVVMQSPNRYIFDHTYLIRYGINPAILPAGSTVINAPPAVYPIEKTTFWGAASGFLVLIGTILLLFVNIGKRHKAETALRQSEEHHRTLMNNLRVGVYRSSPDQQGTFTHANPAMAAMFGFSSDTEFLSVPILDFYQNRQDRAALIEKIRAYGFVKDHEIDMKKRDGSRMIVSCTVTAQRNRQGVIIGLDGVMEDITERKNLEDQLRHAQKMEAVGTLAGGIAHDFNNILTAIIGYANLMKMRAREQDPSTRYISNILSCSEKAANLTRGLLAFSRKQIISPKALDAAVIVRGIESLLARIIGEDIEMKTVFSSERLTIFADQSQIEQVLMNLATNARDAMPRGGIFSISTSSVNIDPEGVKAYGVALPGEYAIISVSDTGMGMPPSTIAKIFEPFFTTKEVGKGTGLGLSMVYGIIKQHNGEVTVYSEEGKGTTFRIYLPLVTTQETTSPPAKDLLEGGTEGILIAEDDADVRDLMSSVLRGFGYRVYEASDGEEAVARFLSQPDLFDLVIMDIAIPRKTGKEAVREMKACRPDLKVLYSSGYVTPDIHHRDIFGEGLAYVSKPVAPDDLVRAVKELLESGKD